MMISGFEDGSIGPLREALTVCAASAMSGVLRVTGDPGGTLYLVDGRVTGLETSGAPGPEVLLLRSGRVTEQDWDAAFDAAATAGRPVGAELLARELVGAGELETLLRVALADGMFVLTRGTVDEYRAEPGPPDGGLALVPGVDADWLLAESVRRIRVLAALPVPVRHARERFAAVPAAVPDGSTLGGGQDEILRLADGRRTPRDLAFALGRGVYGITLQLTRMQEAGLVRSATPLKPALGVRSAGHPAGIADDPDSGPRRGRPLLSLPRRTGAPVRQPEHRTEHRTPRGLLWPRSGRDPGTA